MMPLTCANVGEENIIKKIGGSHKERKFLESLGFIAGGGVTIISVFNGDLIVSIKDAKIAINHEMAQNIMV